jgi:hypothetical protein
MRVSSEKAAFTKKWCQAYGMEGRASKQNSRVATKWSKFIRCVRRQKKIMWHKCVVCLMHVPELQRDASYMRDDVTYGIAEGLVRVSAGAWRLERRGFEGCLNVCMGLC